MSVLVLGGTGEARELAGLLAAHPRFEAVSSLAGRVSEVRVPDGEVRIGGFGGPAGLARWMRERGTDVLVDATHPFAQRMSTSAAEAARMTGVPLLMLRRPGWRAGPGDDWRRVPSMPAAVEALRGLGPRVFLTTGRQDASAFAELDDHRFLLRCVDPPEPPLPRHLRVLLDRGPFTVDGELELLRGHDIDVLVTKDSGGEMTAAKLRAARHLGIPVVVVSRPEPPEGPVVRTPRAAVAWLENHSG
ncbi:cobalt-precorrin-6A reductase [Saccharopolyspora montiporae]|uniref:cobalt-precorrin-6A reductase n=1 Tax=Saccharopolyspora montiporae TaxID=2781240 RepID=UPI00351C8B61